MPLLVQSLSCDEQSLKLSTLQTMYSLVLDAPEIISRQVTALVPMLLGLTKFQLSMVIAMFFSRFCSIFSSWSMARKMGGHCGSDTRRYGIFCLLMCCWKRFCGWLLVRAGWSESCHLIGYPSEKDAHFVPAPKISLLPVFVFRNH